MRPFNGGRQTRGTTSLFFSPPLSQATHCMVRRLFSAGPEIENNVQHQKDLSKSRKYTNRQVALWWVRRSVNCSPGSNTYWDCGASHHKLIAHVHASHRHGAAWRWLSGAHQSLDISGLCNNLWQELELDPTIVQRSWLADTLESILSIRIEVISPYEGIDGEENRT